MPLRLSHRPHKGPIVFNLSLPTGDGNMSKPELSEQIVKLAKDILEEHGIGNCAACGVIYENGALRVSDNTACHAGLNQQMAGRPKPVAVVSVCQTDCNKRGARLDAEHIAMYTDWLLNRSPYNSAFITKDAASCIELGYVATTAEVPSNLMVGGLVAHRYTWEHASLVRTWCELVNAGCNEDTAFLFTHMIGSSFVGGSPVKEVASFGSTYKSGHTALSVGGMTEKDLLNFVNHEPVEPNQPYNVDVEYRGLDDLFGRSAIENNNTVAIFKQLRDVIRLEKEVKLVASLNPFPPIVKKDNDAKDYMQVIRGFATYSDKLLKELLK